MQQGLPLVSTPTEKSFRAIFFNTAYVPGTKSLPSRNLNFVNFRNSCSICKATALLKPTTRIFFPKPALFCHSFKLLSNLPYFKIFKILLENI